MTQILKNLKKVREFFMWSFRFCILTVCWWINFKYKRRRNSWKNKLEKTFAINPYQNKHYFDLLIIHYNDWNSQGETDIRSLKSHGKFFKMFSYEFLFPKLFCWNAYCFLFFYIGWHLLFLKNFLLRIVK